jgi:hypothetical protein
MDLLMPRLLLSLFFISMLSACGSSSSSSNPDIDGDGIANELDAFPQNPRETADTDGDGVGDNSDAFPEDASETLDTDLDGVGDTADELPNDNSESVDSDGDGVGDNADVFPNNANESADLDGDGIGDNADAFTNDVNESVDSDGDGVGNNSDIFPNDNSESTDTDGDGVGDNADAFPEDPNESLDSDGDGIGNNADSVFNVNYDSLGLGNGFSSNYQDGIALTGLLEGESLSAKGTTTVTVNIVDKLNENSENTHPVNVFFTSPCAQSGLAEFIPNKVLASGIATTTYVDKGCGGAHGNTDNIEATIISESDEGILDYYASALTNIDVLPSLVGAIEFIRAVPTTIALRNGGTDSVHEISNLEFQILDPDGSPLRISDREVRFTLDHNIGDASLSTQLAATNQEGIASVQLISGYANGSVRVVASTDALDENGEVVSTISTKSDPVIMTSGLGIMNGFALSVSNYNPGAFDWDGNTIEVEARLSNRYLNPVADGTPISFYATGGHIVSNCITENGACSVTWTSSDPRPIDGVVNITARTYGEGDFQDTNSNGMFDIGERYGTYGELYIDANGNGLYDTTGVYQPTLDINGDGDNNDPDNVNNEFHWNNADYNAPLINGTIEESNDETGNFIESFFDFNDDLILTDNSNKKYQGLACSSQAVDAGHCSELVDISASLRIQMSAYTGAFIEGPFLKTDDGDYDYSQIVECVDGRTDSHQVAWRVADSAQRRNNLAMGSQIYHQATNVSVINENGIGEMPSTPPVLTYLVWELIPENSSLGLEERKNKYLNERGTLVEMLITKPESDTGDTEYGTVNLQVQTLDNVIHLGDTPLKVDLLGNECSAS